MSKFQIIANTADIPIGKTKRVLVNGTDILVANVEGKFFAVSNICSHEHEYLSSGFLLGRQIVCPAHYAVFDVATGEVVRHPDGGTVGPIKAFTVKQENDKLLLAIEG